MIIRLDEAVAARPRQLLNQLCDHIGSFDFERTTPKVVFGGPMTTILLQNYVSEVWRAVSSVKIDPEQEGQALLSVLIAVSTMFVQNQITTYVRKRTNVAHTVFEMAPGLDLLIAAVSMEIAWLVNQLQRPAATSDSQFVLAIIATWIAYRALTWPLRPKTARQETALLNVAEESSTSLRRSADFVGSRHPALGSLLGGAVLAYAAFL